MTQERNPQVVEEFKRRQRKQLLVSLLAIAVALFVFIQADRGGSIAGMSCSSLAIPAFAVILGVLIFSLQNWRCPACNGYLGKAISPRFCSKCGAALQ